MAIDLITFGCRLNALEGEVMKKRAEEAGFGDLIMINTCAVTAEAERQARQKLRRIIRDNPGRRVVITGCSAQNSAANYAKIPGLFAILGNSDKMRPDTYRALGLAAKNVGSAPAGPIVILSEIEKHPSPPAISASRAPAKFDGWTKAFVQVQQGCDNRCAYCVIPYLRGNSVSFSKASVFAQIEAALAGGYKEIALTGVDISSYRAPSEDGGIAGIAPLARNILNAFPQLPRLRLHSLDPARDYTELFEIMRENPRLMPHIHLSMQSGCDRTLRAMRRRHISADLVSVAENARAHVPHIGIGADIIVGFPGETDEDFAETLATVRLVKPSRLHVFPYSPRPGTSAAALENQLPADIKKSRAKALRIIGSELEIEFVKSLKGQIRPVLVEEDGRGYTDNFVMVEFKDADHEPGAIVDYTF